ncbi:MAG: DUF397 domain-containing protein, partial [Phycisphaerae bacterium]|nr:DUF397 domain-containing protein [Phycisphaerae bacterium]
MRARCLQVDASRGARVAVRDLDRPRRNALHVQAAELVAFLHEVH